MCLTETRHGRMTIASVLNKECTQRNTNCLPKKLPGVGGHSPVIQCNDLSGKQPNRQVGVNRVVTCGSQGGVAVSTLAQNARGAGSNPALGAIFPLPSPKWRWCRDQYQRGLGGREGGCGVPKSVHHHKSRYDLRCC